MKPRPIRLALTASLLLAACEPTILVERDATARIAPGSTWTWTAPDGDGLAPDDGNVVPTEPVARALIDAITTELEAKGFRRVSADSAQFFVHFHLGRREVVDTLLPTAASRPRTAGDRDPQGWGAYGSPEELRNRTITWQEGMMVIDALTPDGATVAWRGIAVGEVRPGVEDAPQQAIRAAVSRLLRDFP